MNAMLQDVNAMLYCVNAMLHDVNAMLYDVNAMLYASTCVCQKQVSKKKGNMKANWKILLNVMKKMCRVTAQLLPGYDIVQKIVKASRLP